jgi:hypothetical protein
MRKMLRLALALCFLGAPLVAQTQLRVATYNLGLGRDGPGLLLGDILKQKPEILALAATISTADPDIILLTGFDNDYQNIALQRFNTLEGLRFPFLFAPLGNEGAPSGLDINGNGRLQDWNDAWGYGRFEGHKAMALLSRYPIGKTRVFNRLLWQDFGPNPQAPHGAPFYPPALWPQLRLAAHSLWDVEILAPDFPLHILAAHPTPPVFDGPENANGLRNAAEISFLNRYLDGEAFQDDSGQTAPLATEPVVLLADLNADPAQGDSLKPALRTLLAHSRLQDPIDQPTVDWPAVGRLRVDYVLPDARLTIRGAGVIWPEEQATPPLDPTRHKLVWANIALSE